MAEVFGIIFLEIRKMDREGFEPSISPMPRAYPTSLDDRPKFSELNSDRLTLLQMAINV